LLLENDSICNEREMKRRRKKFAAYPLCYQSIGKSQKEEKKLATFLEKMRNEQVI